ncbi:hypothetical protein EMIT0194MI4_20261 [Pseudomonas sp. IT-194MI4]
MKVGAALTQVLAAAHTLAASRQVKRAVTVFMLASPRSLRDARIAVGLIDALNSYSFALVYRSVSQCSELAIPLGGGGVAGASWPPLKFDGLRLQLFDPQVPHKCHVTLEGAPKGSR